jgi:cytochrome P450
MCDKPEEYAGPTWTDDHLDSPDPPEIKAPYFDERLGAWVLTRYADVLAAFRSPSLVPAGARGNASTDTLSEADRLKMRAETRTAVSLRHLRKWQKVLAPEVSALTRSLLAGQPIDLVGEFARPLCLVLAVAVTGADPNNAEQLEKLARHVSASAAEPYDTKIRSRSNAANARLHNCFPAGPESLRSSGFVALSQTMPSLLANAWYGLLQHPQQWGELHQRPSLAAKAVEELQRYAGLTRLTFRQAAHDVILNGVRLRKGDRVILRIAAANRDPDRFPHPEYIDWLHHGTGHLSLGAGPHSCVGASLIRMAAVTITRPLIERFASAEIAGPVEWRGGPIFRSPASLPVRLYEGIPAPTSSVHPY